MSISSKSVSRRGFTLVELLVVITIIGILVSLLVPTLAVVIKKSRENAIAMEIKQLAAAMEAFRQERIKKSSVYPPDFSDIDPSTLTRNTPAMQNLRASELQTFLRVMSRNTNRSYAVNWMQNQVGPANVAVFQAPIFGSATADPRTLDAAESLVLWLGMTQKNPEAPLPSRFARPSGPGFSGPSGTGTWTFFEFDESRLVDQDQDGWPEYLQAHGAEAPYLYFSGPYEIFDTSNNPPTILFADSFDGAARGQGIARPFFGTGTAGQPVTGTENKFQIVAAGYDGVFSTYDAGNDPNAALSAAVFDPNRRRTYPTGVNFTEVDMDNITSFAEGRNDNQLD